MSCGAGHLGILTHPRIARGWVGMVGQVDRYLIQTSLEQLIKYERGGDWFATSGVYCFGVVIGDEALDLEQQVFFWRQVAAYYPQERAALNRIYAIGVWKERREHVMYDCVATMYCARTVSAAVE